ncbi:MAG: hypothetical protein PF588_00395 [Candidatus Kapabacteria bacterium]|nr:hypothetical protein [Candidatus Kapabacteria bacterium]
MDSKGAEIASYFVYFLYVQEIPANNTITFDVYWKFDPMIENIEAYEIQLKYNDVVIR